jgi:phosphatidylinositol-3-phosphatase
MPSTPHLRLAALAVAALLSACGTGSHGSAAPTTAPTTGPATAPPAASAGPATGGGPPAPSGSPGAAGRPDHVVVAVFENKDYAQIAGNAKAPYLNTLLDRGAAMVNSHGVAHPSQPNYLALFSGSDQHITDDRCFAPLANRPNLGRQLIDAGRTFTGYSEDQPGAGFTGCSAGRYAAKHNPWVHFGDLPPDVNQPFTAFPGDFATLPTVAFVVPNLCNDMHDCPVATGDAWARQHLDPYLRWADSHNSLLILTFDENDGRPDNTILTVFAGAGIKPGRYDERVDHYRVLRTIEDLYRLPPLGAAANAAPITTIWR